jgi:hypothetical protein
VTVSSPCLLPLQASFQVQVANLKRQLALVNKEAEQARQEAERSRQKGFDARKAVQDLVDAVTQLADHLDGANALVTQSFEAVARGTQTAFEAVISVQTGVDQLLEAEEAVREAAASPLPGDRSSLSSVVNQEEELARYGAACTRRSFRHHSAQTVPTAEP